MALPRERPKFQPYNRAEVVMGIVCGVVSLLLVVLAAYLLPKHLLWGIVSAGVGLGVGILGCPLLKRVSTNPAWTRSWAYMYVWMPILVVVGSTAYAVFH